MFVKKYIIKRILGMLAIPVLVVILNIVGIPIFIWSTLNGEFEDESSPIDTTFWPWQSNFWNF